MTVSEFPQTIEEDLALYQHAGRGELTTNFWDMHREYEHNDQCALQGKFY